MLNCFHAVNSKKDRPMVHRLKFIFKVKLWSEMTTAQSVLPVHEGQRHVFGENSVEKEQ